jgi:hypothetical protein
MARTRQQTPAPSPVGLAAAEPADVQRLVEELDSMLSRLRLGAIREQLDGLLEEAARRQLNLREALAGHPTNSGAKAPRNSWGPRPGSARLR